MSVSVKTSIELHASLYRAAGIEVSDGSPRLHVGDEDAALPGITIQLRRCDAFQPRPLGGSRPWRVLSLSSLGGPFVDLRRITAMRSSGDEIHALDVGEIPFQYGPGAPIPFLPTDRYRGLGTSIDRDDPQIIDAFSRRASGELWIRPAHPSVPSFSTWRVNGKTVVGALCDATDVAGSYVLLTPADVVALYGYRLPEGRTLEPQELEGLVPLEPLERLLEWTNQNYA